MLNIITTLTDELRNILRDDPVRPEIPAERRINTNSRVYILSNDGKPQAVTCVKFLRDVPAGVDDLLDNIEPANTAVFYTIWSYAAGAGRSLIVEAQQSIKHEFPLIKTYVTLSPKTEMARKFHLRNGAGVYRENLDTVNYIYQ